MFRTAALGLPFALLSACEGDQTLRSYGAADKTWQLVELNGAAFPDTATLTFPDRNKIAGQGPCNHFAATLNVPYPWFEVTELISTKMTCPAFDQETLFFDSLSAASLSEVLGNTLILSNPDGLTMVFNAAD
ncbi:META domain-containing protein [Sulfitobacter sp. HGT1]|uniref:META domain-containing protein n=1 Tax=Sulfitobacter sp. HGT1 TaxID=2735435 RepID=UPI0015944595|nr:META domain-containing protein [Sulfitobacter sp. HGT1]